MTEKMHEPNAGSTQEPKRPEGAGAQANGAPEDGAGALSSLSSPPEEIDPTRAGDASSAQEPLTEEALQALQEKAARSDLYKDELLRARADLDNYQKRVRRERPAWEAHAVRGLIKDLLPVLDNLERALKAVESGQMPPESLAEGVRLIHQMFQKALRSHDVVEIEALDHSFDPELHEALAEEELPDRETGQVIAVHQRGYVHKGVVVRPSQVKIAKKLTK
jgi:molecular chaperone GrpE